MPLPSSGAGWIQTVTGSQRRNRALGAWLLIDDDSMHHRFGAVWIRPLKKQPLIMPDEPGVQRLHPSKVGHLDGWFGQLRSP
jgi:hypothetical protein